MDLIEQFIGIAIFIAVALGLTLLSGASEGTSSLEERVARGEISQEQYRAVLLSRLGSL
ncbi:MAG TPA: hypothetical protein VFW12_10040 [Candidatus Limnocylindria bacterium]|nr:hypothetical protein [Candidatus Limnocylindria bacterium]